LAVISVAGSGLRYKKASGYNAQAVCTDMLYGSFSNQQRKVKAEDEITRRIILCAVDITPEETAALAKSVKINDTAEGKDLQFNLPEGGQTKVTLR
jgi:hypothetical protein